MHEVPSWINAMAIAVAAMAGLNTALLAWLVYFSSRRRRREEWLRHLIELHSLFWKGEDFSRVRSWLACPESYATLRPILRKRRAVADKVPNAEPVTDDDYALIDELDRFLNLLMRIVVLNPEFNGQRQLWRRLFDDYWLRALRSHEDLDWYARTFYRELYEEMSVSINGATPPSETRVIAR